MLPIKKQAEDEAQPSGAENKNVRKRQSEPANDHEAHGNNRADRSSGDVDGAEELPRTWPRCGFGFTGS